MLRKIFATGTILMLALVFAGCTLDHQPAGTPPDELNWWPSKAVPQPIQDSKSDGHYWWPTDRGEESSELWGNRGYVYVLRSEDDKTAEPAAVTKLPRDVKPVEALQLRDVHFHYDSAKLTPAAQELLLGAAATLKAHPEVSITLEGHTCSCGPQAYNLNLGLERADSVMKFLSNNGIDAGKIKTISYGETRPIVDTEEVEKCILLPESNSIRVAHQKNRRVEFRLETKE